MGAMFRQDDARIAIFEGLDVDQISQLAPFMVECSFDKDEVIFEQGKPAEHLFILLSGEVVINYKPYDGPPLVVARIEPGGVFGWSAALSRDLYTSEAVAVEKCSAYRLRGSNLQVIRSRYPQTGQILLERLAGCIAERLRSTHTQVLEILTQGMDVHATAKRRNKNERK